MSEKKAKRKPAKMSPRATDALLDRMRTKISGIDAENAALRKLQREGKI